jgi:hypothetical protein
MGVFKFEDDPLKHYVRTQAWLPACRRRLKQVRAKAGKASKARRLRYFTFCAIGAIDVLMLDVANIIRRSSNKEFDTVVFFDRGDLEVIETLKRIPGAHGYPGDFVKIVLLGDPDEEAAVDALEALAAPPDEPNRAETRARQRSIAMRQSLLREFPFDVINLDLEGYFFTPGDPFPGRLIRALRKMLEWQKIPINDGTPAGERLDGFSLMFTTQIGPPNLTDNYLTMLRDAIQGNLDREEELHELLQQRAGSSNPAHIQAANFALFFKVALPKLILAMLLEADWYADPQIGVTLYEIERPSADGPYHMLHVVLDVKRQDPPICDRAPGAGHAAEALTAYQHTAQDIFVRQEVSVTEAILDLPSLEASLERIYARRRKYYPEVEEDTGE